MDNYLFGYWKLVAMRFLNLDRVRKNEGVNGGTLALTKSGDLLAFLKANRQVFGVCGTFEIQGQKIVIRPTACSDLDASANDLMWTVKKLTPSEMTVSMVTAAGGPCEADFELIENSFTKKLELS